MPPADGERVKCPNGIPGHARPSDRDSSFDGADACLDSEPDGGIPGCLHRNAAGQGREHSNHPCSDPRGFPRHCRGGRSHRYQRHRRRRPQEVHSGKYRRRSRDLRFRQRRVAGRVPGQRDHARRQGPRREIDQSPVPQSRQSALRGRNDEIRAGAHRLGTGRLRRRLRQRRAARSVRDLLRPQRAVSQRRRRSVPRRHQRSGAEF